MDDFRNEFYEKKTKAVSTPMLIVIILAIISTVFSAVALYRVLQATNGGTISSESKMYIATDTGNDTQAEGQSETSVTAVSSAMENKVVSVLTYGNAGAFGIMNYAQVSSGSGFIVTTDGYVVTNYHVVEAGDTYKVKIGEDIEYDAQLTGYDESSDLAVLKIQSSDTFEPVVIGDSDALQVGEMAIAIGSPLGEELNNSVTVGYISAKDRDVSSNGINIKMLQTDAAINPGNSGGPLLDSSGTVIGINTLKSNLAGYDSQGNAISSEGIGFAIPISDAMPIIEEIISTGSYSRPAMGISYAVIDEATATRNNLPEGIIIVEIVSNSPAQKAGLEVDDIITSMDGTAIQSSADLNSALSTKQIGDKINLKVVRDGNEIDIELTLEDVNIINENETQEETTQTQSNWLFP